MLKYPKSEALTFICPTISLLMNISILLLSILLVSGISIVFDSLTVCQIALIMSSTILFSVSLFALEFISKTGNDIIFFIFMIVIFIIGYILYFISIVYLSKLATQALIIHLEMISQRGINPNTTPTYKKINMLKFTRNSSISLFFIMVLCYVLFYADFIPYWIVYAIKTVAMLTLVGIICYKCRIRQAMASTYGDDEDAYIVNDGIDNENCVNINELNDRIKHSIGEKVGKQSSESKDMIKNDSSNISRDNKKYETSEAEDDGLNLNNITNQEDETRSNKANEDQTSNEISNEENNQRTWKPGDVLPHIPQIHKLHNKIYSKDPDD